MEIFSILDSTNILDTLQSVFSKWSALICSLICAPLVQISVYFVLYLKQARALTEVFTEVGCALSLSTDS